MAFQSIEQILEKMEQTGLDMAMVVMEEDCRECMLSPEVSRKKMEAMWDTMVQASREYDAGQVSQSGLVGTDGGKMEKYVQQQKNYTGDFVGNVVAEALKMGENNACMKRIVAAPTAGSCGVIPSVLLVSYRQFAFPVSKMVDSLYVAAGIGQVIGHRASLAGASGGCQAEVGAAAAMAAGALVYLRDGSGRQIADGIAMALKNMLGLVCDPVAGLVEVPCVKRNVAGAMNAISAADMALAGISSRIPVDQVIDAMREIGDDMDPKYKETACGGCAATPWAKEWKM